MKYIKTFEAVDYKIYWLIPTDERFKDSLKKINCSKYYLKTISGVRDSEKKLNHDYMFVGYSEGVNDMNLGWGWNVYIGKIKDAWYEEHGYKFGGTINIPEFEFEIKKYNI